MEIEETAETIEPFVSYSQLPDAPPIQEREVEPTPMWNALGASVALNNPFFGWDNQQFESDSEYSAWDDPENILGYPVKSFAGSRSLAETEHIKAQMDYDRFARQEMADAGGFTGFLADTAAVLSNPIYAIPGIAAGRLSTIVFGEMLAESVTEMALHDRQYERTFAQSAISVASAGLFTGLVGSAAMRLASKSEIKVGNEATARFIDKNLDFSPEKGSVGAKMVETSIEDETMKGGITKTAVGVMSRLLESPFIGARKLAQDLADNPFLMNKHMDETSSGPSVESLMGEHEGRMATALTGATSQYKKYKSVGGTMTDVEFNKAIGRQLSYPDRKAIPEVRAAADYHRKVYDDDLKWAIHTGRLPEGTHAKGAVGYRPRLYDRKKLLGRQAEFISLLSEHLYNGIKHGTLVRIEFKGNRMAIPATRYEALKRQNPGMIAVTGKVPNNTTMKNEATAIAEQVHRDLVYHSPADVPVTGLVGPAGSLEARTIGLSDAALEPFLETRADLVLRNYTREMSFDRAIFDKLGEHDLTDTLDKIVQDAQRKVSKAPEAKREKLHEQLARDIKDLQALRDIVARKYGRPEDYTAWHKAGAYARLYTNATSLGGVVYTSIPDVARIPMKYGFKPFMKGITRLMTGHAQLSKSARTDLGIAIDRITSGRIRSMAELGEDVRNPTSVATDAFFTWSLMNHWTDAMQSLSSEVFADTAIKWMRKGTKKQKAMLARSGLDNEISAKILSEYKESGSLDPRVWLDEEAAQYWGAALRNEMKHTIIEPGAGDLPLVMHSEAGRFIGQFKSFMFAAHNKMLVAGVQQNDANFYAGLIFSTILAGLVSEGKNAVRDKDGPDTIFDKLFNAADRTGMLGVWAVPMVTGYSLAGGTASRRISQDLSGTALGPNIGKFERLTRTASRYAAGDDVDFDWGLVPLTNLHHFKDLAERAND